ncbi:MAG: CDC48 family AAA ATPase [Thermodesulfobacteriota bacterium]
MISLRIIEIHAAEAGKGYARISERNMTDLGVTTWDLIEIGGKRKTFVRAIPIEPNGYKNGEGESIIEIDLCTRENARVDIDEFVIVKKADSKNATRVLLSPRNNDLLYAPEKLKFIPNRLEGIPLTVGDKISVKMPGSSGEDFDVVNTTPSQCVVVSQTTKVDIRKKPTGKIDGNNICYDDIGGLTDQINKIREMIELPLKFPQVFEKLGIDPPRGVLLVGPPGSGKTVLAKAIANESNVNFQVINGPEIIHKFYGESEAKIRKIFDVAARHQPSILFLDELDAIAPRREKVTGDVEKRVVSQLLTLMDGLKERGNIIVIGATNLPDVIDPALRRPGRFDREIYLNVPDQNSRYEILNVHSRGMPLYSDIDLDKISEITHGFIGADIENLCKEAAMIALRRTLPDLEYYDESFEFEDIKPLMVNMNDFLEALKEINPSAIREIFVEIPKVTWDDVGGLSDIKDKLTESVILPLKHKDLFKSANVKPPKGILFSGPPGTGKTLLAKALANQSNINFISVKGAELLSKYVGESEKSIREVFRKAKQVSPSIIFFDEIDAVAPLRQDIDSNRVSERVVSQLLTEMDGVEELVDVFVLASTNRIDMVDPAILRSGRFDLILNMPYPDVNEINEILKIHTRDKPLNKDIKLENIASKLKGLCGADIELICNRSAILAIRDHLINTKRVFTISVKHFNKSIREFKNRNK